MNKKQVSKVFTRREALKIGAGAAIGLAAFGKTTALEATPEGQNSEISVNKNSGFNGFNFLPAGDESKVDFSYTFATPHRITAGFPDAGDRTLLDLQSGSLRMAWTYDNLSMESYAPLTFHTPKTDWGIKITPLIDGKSFSDSRWTRLDKFLPGVDNVYEEDKCSVRLQVLGGVTGALVQIELDNADLNVHQFSLSCDSGNWGENPAWLDAKRNLGDNLVAGWNEKADRILIFGLGADSYSLKEDNLPNSAKNMILVWNLKPGEKRQGWIVRPYKAYKNDLPDLRKHDWAMEMEKGREVWNNLLGRACKLNIPDTGVSNAYLACLADLFIMREPLADGRMIGVPGTEVYRAGNSGEPLIVDIALDQNGFHSESAAGSSVSFEMQDPDGCWADKRGWMHTMWCGSGFKSWAIMEHYRLTGDKNFLADVYPRMIASSRWQERQRAQTRVNDSERPVTYGLMPRGFGDCGLMNDDDMYGVFFPHNIWAVYADRCSLEAAEILGKTGDVEELKRIYETAYNDLLVALDSGSIEEKGYRWIPGVAGKRTGSCWGALNIVTPCGLMSADNELVTGTLRKIEANLSKGGQPVHTGWMADGAWVAITLDNIAEVHLARGNGDTAINYLYSTLNHGTPLYTWCEERGQEPGTTKCSGDRQHLWTPVAVVRIIRDIMVMENGDELDLALGTAREWLGSGKKVGIADAYTHFGKVSYNMQFDSKGSKVTGEVRFEGNTSVKSAVLHIRLPEGMKVKSVNSESKAGVLPDGSGIKWKLPKGTIKFSAKIEA